MLWWWCVDHAEDGDLRKFNDTHLTIVIESNPNQAKDVVDALVHAGFLEREPYFRIRNWWKFVRRFMQQRYKDRPEKWAKIEALYIESTAGSDTGPVTGPVAVSATQETKPNQPNQPNKPMRKDGAQQDPKDGFGLSSGLEEEAFLRFWKFYPKKRSKGDAEKAWKSIKPGSELVEKILDALKRAKTSRDWLKENGKFVPYPATWLRSKGWEDEFDGVAPPAPGADVRRRILEVQGLIPVGGEM